MRFLSLCKIKLRAMFGGAAPMLAVYALLLLLCWAVLSAINAPLPETVSILVVDLDETEQSRALYSALAGTDGLSAEESDDEEKALRALSLGHAEGLLVIGEGYADALNADESNLLLRYESAPLSYSAQAVREMIAGEASRQRAFARAYADAEAALGELTPEQEAELARYLEEPAPAAYTLRESGGRGGAAQNTVYAAFSARYHGFGALCIMLFMLTLASFYGREESRLVALRMAVLPHGKPMSIGSDVACLFFAGLFMAALILLPLGLPALGEVLMFAAYVFALTGLCLLVGSVESISGRADVLSPFVVLITGLIGGCFMDLSSLSPAMEAMACFTPEGLLLAGLSGKAFAGPALLLIGAACLFLAYCKAFLKKKSPRPAKG